MFHQFGKAVAAVKTKRRPDPASYSETNAKPKIKMGAAPTQASIYAALKKRRMLEEQAAVATTSPTTKESAQHASSTSIQRRPEQPNSTAVNETPPVAASQSSSSNNLPPLDLQQLRDPQPPSRKRESKRPE